MKTYFLGCNKHKDAIGSKKSNCMPDKSRFLEQESNKRSNSKKINPKLLIY